jgi:PAS domain-containing protein
VSDTGLLIASLPAAAAAVTGGLAVYAWHHRDGPGAVPLSAALLAVVVWCTTEVLALSETGASHLFWEKVQWLAIAVVPLLFFLFMADFTGHEWVLSPRIVPLFFFVPVVTVGMVWTNPTHHLMWDNPVHISTGGVVTLSLDFGLWFWLYFVYAYTLLIVGFILLLRLVTVSEYLYLDQTVLIVVGILAPLVGNGLSVFELSPLPGLDLTPYAFAVTGLAFGNLLVRYRLFDLLPATRRLGRQAALVDLNDGIVIVDTDRQVLYMNPAAGDILDCDPNDAVGDAAERLVDTDEFDFAATDRLAELSLGDRTYEVETAPISDRHDRHVGHTILLYDVTERTRREQELRAQRDRFQRLERINTLIREVNQVLVSATTVDELEQGVVDTLAAPGLYDEVWISTTAGDRSSAATTAGDDALARAEGDAVPATVDAPEAGESVEMRLPVDPDRASGEDWATVALVYGRTVYGALALHTSRERGFGERELAVLDELGETIGHALNAIERTRLLVSDSRVELDLQSTDDDGLLVALATQTDSDWQLDGLVPADDGDLLLYLSGSNGETGADVAAAHAGVTEVRPLATDGNTSLEVTASAGTLAHPLVEFGANVRTATAADGSCRLTAEVSPDTNVRAAVGRVTDSFPDTELVAKREVDPTDDTALPDAVDITDRQQEALEAAYRAGYFSWPRESTAEEVADSLDITAATLHGHLRKAEGRLVETFFEE